MLHAAECRYANLAPLATPGRRGDKRAAVRRAQEPCIGVCIKGIAEPAKRLETAPVDLHPRHAGQIKILQTAQVDRRSFLAIWRTPKPER